MNVIHATRPWSLKPLSTVWVRLAPGLSDRGRSFVSLCQACRRKRGALGAGWAGDRSRGCGKPGPQDAAGIGVCDFS